MNVSQFLGHTVEMTTGKAGKRGNLFGLELELEGHNVKMDAVPTKGWHRAEDGSLRGESVEYVFSTPVKLDTAKALVTSLFQKFKENGVRLNNSYRTSTHVHLNFSDKTMKQVLNFMVLFTMLEEALETFSGEDRGGNLFCLSSRRAEGIMNVLYDAYVKRQDLAAFKGDAYKYAACNLCTLIKFGSIEVRTMRGANNPEMVNSWLDILNDLYERSLKAKSPIEFIENVSVLGIDGFLRDVFSAESLRTLQLALPAFNWQGSVMSGARLCQMLCYEIGDDFNKVVNPMAAIEHNGNPLTHEGPLFYGEHDIRIFRPGAGGWYCEPMRGKVFNHGMPITDAAHIIFDATVGRFMDQRGNYYWYKNHPFFGNEDMLRHKYGPYWTRDIVVGAEAEVNEDDDNDEDEEF